MDSEKVIKRDNAYVLHTYARNPIAIEKGHGLYAEGPEGQKYLDFTSGIGVNSLGYCDMTWAEAVSEQAHKLQHTSNLYYTAPCGKLAKKLCKRTGMSKVFFGNSGAEANEGAIKAARKYSFDKYGADRYNVITLVNSFHGRTIATLTATGQGVFHNYFGPFNEGFQYVKAGDIDALTEMVDRHTCAVMLELVQGEGGVVALEPEYVQAVRALCDEKDLVLIVDEVQTGVGRTGTFLCCEHYNLQPDVVTLAKGLGGGLPIGAVLMNEKVAAGMGPSSHGSTFGGNPVVCAGANVVVDRMDASFLANVNERAVQLRNKERHPHIASFCGTGNNVQFLTDPTGNRRWLPFEVSQIRDPHLHAIPYELVYSQAYALWKSGFCHWFSQEEIRKLNMHNSRFEVPNLEEDLIRTHFRKPFEGEAGIFVTAADILEQISSCLRYPLSPNKIGRIMAGLEFESIRYKGKRGYIAVKKTGEDIDRERRSGALGL